jgi:hypothetical protein
MVLRNACRHNNCSFVVGDVVTLAVPRNQSSSDFSHFFCRILSNPHGYFYELKCKNRTLRGLFSGGELREVSLEVANQYKSIISMDGSGRPISLAVASRLAQTGPPPVVTCQCQQQCTKGRCGCMKAGILCSKGCHGKSTRRCHNFTTAAAAGSRGEVSPSTMYVALYSLLLQTS